MTALFDAIVQILTGDGERHVRHIFRDLVDTPADVSISERNVHLHFHRRAHLPIIIASGIFDAPVKGPWRDSYTLRMCA